MVDLVSPTSFQGVTRPLGYAAYEQEARKNSLAEALAQAQIMKAMRPDDGSEPAAVKITNKMLKAAEDYNNPDLSEPDRLKAKFTFDTLHQVSKSYGIDRGMIPGMPAFGSPPTYNTQAEIPNFGAPPATVPTFTPPPRNMPTNQAKNTPMTPDQAAAIGDIFTPSAARPVNLFGSDGNPVGGGVQAVPGFNALLADREAAVKGAGKQAEKDVELRMDPDIEKGKKRAGEIGKFEGEEYNDLTNRTARMPQLIDVSRRLSALGKLSTYTYAGQARDEIMRQTGMDVPDSAVARSAYISMVDNEILPLLRETFGAQFTQKEGDSLKITLGDPDKSPEEKDAVVRSFLQTKMETINTGARKLGQPEIYTPEDIQFIVSSIGASQPSISGNTPIIKTQAQYDALPSGAVYMEIGDDGKPMPMRKP